MGNKITMKCKFNLKSSLWTELYEREHKKLGIVCR